MTIKYTSVPLLRICFTFKVIETKAFGVLIGWLLYQPIREMYALSFRDLVLKVLYKRYNLKNLDLF